MGGYDMRVVQMQAVLRKLSKSVLLLAVLSALGATPVLADTITVDEHGNGFYTFTGGQTVPIAFAPIIPGGGLNYFLTVVPPVADGRVILTPGPGDSCPGVLPFGTPGCDVLTFSGNILTFTSDALTDPADSLADSNNLGVFVPLVGPIALIPETGPEGSSGAFYAPNPGNPGFGIGTDGQPITYNFISDGLATVPEPVPEPGSLLLLGTGIIGILGLRKKK